MINEMIRPLERIGFELEFEQYHEAHSFAKFIRTAGDVLQAVVIQMERSDLEPRIGFAEQTDNDKYDTLWYVDMPYSVIQSAMEEAAYFASYVIEMFRKEMDVE